MKTQIRIYVLFVNRTPRSRLVPWTMGKKSLVLMPPKFETKHDLGFGINHIRCSDRGLLQELQRIKHHTIPFAKANIIIACLNVSYRKK